MYKIFGTECVKYFEGMWAFAIFDSTKKLSLYQEIDWEKNLCIFLKIKETFSLDLKLNL